MNSLSAWKQSLTATELTAAWVLAALAALVCLYLAFRYLHRARLIEDTPTSRIRSAAQGYVELVGPVIGGEAGELRAPLSLRPCVWYRYRVQRYRKSGKRSHWQTVRRGESEAWFQINDDTGTCAIDPGGAEVVVDYKRTWYGHQDIPALNTDAGFFSAFSDDRYRYIEELIMPHETLYALGHFQTVGGGRNLPSTQAQVGEVIRRWKADYDRLLEQYDRNGDGQIDLQEWEAVRQAAEKEARRERGELAQVPAVNVLMRSPDRRYPFILSTRSQKHLGRRFRFYSAGLGVLGALGAGLALFLLQ